MDLLSCYRVLGVPPGTPMEQLHLAYRQQALRFHPDRSPEGHAQFCRITEAYSTLRQALGAVALSRPVGVCAQCGRVAELFKTVTGRSCCAECCLNTRRRFLPLPQFVTISCVATIVLLLAAAACGLFCSETGEVTFGVTGFILGLLSFASLAYYLWSADVILAPPAKRSSSPFDGNVVGSVLIVIILGLILLVLALCLLSGGEEATGIPAF